MKSKSNINLFIFSFILVFCISITSAESFGYGGLEDRSITVTTLEGNLTNISQMDDVNPAGWTDGESLVYNSATGKWESTAVGGLSWSNIVNGTMFSQEDWDTNYTANDAAWRLNTDTFQGNYTNFTTVYNYALNNSGISWANAVNGTLLSQTDWDTNYTANNANWLADTDTFQANYSTFLTHIGWAEAINGTLFSQADWDTNYTANDAAWRLDTDTFQGNYTNFTTVYNYALNNSGISWANAVNGTLLSQADWDTNYTANNDPWLNTTNLSYVPYDGATQNVDIGIYNFTTKGTGFFANIVASLNGSFGADLLVSQDFFVLDDSFFAGDIFPTTTLNSDIGSGAKRWALLFVQNISSDYINNAYDIATANLNASGNITADGFFLGNGSQLTDITLTEVDPYWNGNWTNFSTVYGYALNGSDLWNANYSTFLTHIDWSEAINGTLLSQADWDTNYTANNNAWLNTTNLTYSGYNSTGLIQDWNSTGYIANWNASGFIANWSLASIVESDPFWTANQTNYYTKSEVTTNITAANTTMKAYVDSLNHDGITWVNATNGTLLSQADWDTNYTANNDLWLNNTGILWSEAINGTLFTQLLWNINYTANNANWLVDTDTFQGNYSNFTTVYNYALNNSGISWANAVNGTLLSQADWDTNYTANDAIWRNNTGILWSEAINGTLFSQADWNTNYTANDAAWRLDTDTFQANYSEFLTHIGWAEAINGTLFSQADWNTNYTANDAAWRTDTDTWAGNFTNYFTSAEVITYINANDTTVNNSMKAYVDSLNHDGITWVNATNGTLLSQADWDTNYTANNNAWLNTTNLSIAFETVNQINKVGNPTHIDDLQELYNHIYSAGVMHDCNLTNNGDGSISISSGYASLRATNDSHATLYSIEVDAQANIALTDNETNYVYLDWNAGSPEFVVGSSVNDFNCQDKCVGYIIVREQLHLDILDVREQNVDSNQKLRRRELETSGFTHVLGGSVIDSTLLNISLTSGAFYYELTKTSHDAIDISTGDQLHYYYTDDSGATWNEDQNGTLIDNLYWNDVTAGLTLLGNNKYKVDWVYVINNEPSHVAVLYGQEEYANLADAEAANLPAYSPASISGLGALVGRVIVQKSGIVMITESAFTQSYSSSTPTTHNGLSGLDGGTANQYYHLILSAYTELTEWLDDVVLSDGGNMNLVNGNLTANKVLASDWSNVTGSKITNDLNWINWTHAINGTLLSQADWDTNYTANDAAWRLDTDTFQGNYSNFTTVYNYALNNTGILWSEAVNGTLLSQADWDTNYTTNNDLWLNNTGILWSEATNGTLFTQLLWDTNYTANDAAWRLDTDTWAGNFTNYFTSAEVITYINANDTTVNNSMKAYVDSLNHDGITWANAVNGTLFTQLLWDTNYTANDAIWLNNTGILWSEAINGTLFSQADWDTNYTANDAAWRLDTDTFQGNYTNFTTVYNYALNNSGISWANAVNGTLLSQADWDTNYTANDAIWRNNTGILWSEAINGTLLTAETFTQTEFDINYTANNELWLNNTGILWSEAVNGTLFSQAEFDTNYTANDAIYRAGITWANAINGTLFSQADWDTNYTSNDAIWRDNANIFDQSLNTTDDVTFDSLDMSGNLTISADGSTTDNPRTGAFNDLSAGEAVRFMFGDKHNAFQNAYAEDLQLYSYWGIVLEGGRQDFGSGFDTPNFSKTLDTGVLIMSSNDIGDDGGSSGNPITVLGIMGAPSGTANLTEWRNNDSDVLASVSSDGNITSPYFLGDGSFLTGITEGISWANAVNGTLLSQADWDTNYTANNALWLNNTGILWSEAINGTLFSQADWNTNYTANDAAWRLDTDTFQGNYTNFTTVYNYALNNTGITWENAVNGTLLSQADWDTNYTANDAIWRNNTGILWSEATNGTLFSQADWNTNYTANDAAWRLDTDTFQANYSTFLTHIGWAEAINGTLFSQADWNTNYTANDAAWRLDTDTWAGNFTNYFTSAEVITYINANDTTVNNSMKAYVDVTFLEDVVDDATPQLGGYLDANGENIGSTTDEIENIYVGTNTRIYFGDGQEANVYYNGTVLIMEG